MNPYVATALGDWRSKLHIIPVVPLSNAPRATERRLDSSAGACGVSAGLREHLLTHLTAIKSRAASVPSPCTALGMEWRSTRLARESLLWTTHNGATLTASLTGDCHADCATPANMIPTQAQAHSA